MFLELETMSVEAFGRSFVRCSNSVVRTRIWATEDCDTRARERKWLAEDNIYACIAGAKRIGEDLLCTVAERVENRRMASRCKA